MSTNRHTQFNQIFPKCFRGSVAFQAETRETTVATATCSTAGKSAEPLYLVETAGKTKDALLWHDYLELG